MLRKKRGALFVVEKRIGVDILGKLKKREIFDSKENEELAYIIKCKKCGSTKYYISSGQSSVFYCAECDNDTFDEIKKEK